MQLHPPRLCALRESPHPKPFSYTARICLNRGMTQPCPHRSIHPLHPRRWTPLRLGVFLATLEASGSVGAAVRAAGMSRQSAYRLRARHPDIGAAWALAERAGRVRGAGGGVSTSLDTNRNGARGASTSPGTNGGGTRGASTAPGTNGNHRRGMVIPLGPEGFAGLGAGDAAHRKVTQGDRG